MNNIEMVVYNSAGTQVLCRSAAASVRSDLLNKQSFTLPSGCNLATGSYLVRMVGAGGSNSILSSYIGFHDFNVFGVPVKVANRVMTFDNGGNAQKQPRVLFAATSRQSGSGVVMYDCDEIIEIPVTPTPEPTPWWPTDSGGDGGGDGGGGGGGGCPLIINLNPQQQNVKKIPLTSPWDGIWFDLLGQNSKPYPHAKSLISWIQDYAFAWLVKPRPDGKVVGIDQLFGNNTLLPHGGFASNGYTALATYDGTTANADKRLKTPDSLIDRKDAVFKDLKVWVDHDFNGVASDSELFSLDQVGIDSIDLNYDSRYVESDQYGNRTTMRSVVKMRDGTYRLIFDLWFKL